MRRDDAYLLDMLTAARDAISLTSDLTREQFLASQLHQLAIIKLIETIGLADAAYIAHVTSGGNTTRIMSRLREWGMQIL